MITGHFLDSYLPALDGVVRVAQSARAHMERRFGPSYIIAPSAPGHLATDERVIRYFSLPFRRPYRIGMPRLDPTLASRLHRVAFDVIHSHALFGAGELAHRIARRSGRPLVFTLHSRTPEWVAQQYACMPSFAALHWGFETMASPRVHRLHWRDLFAASPRGSAFVQATMRRHVWRYCIKTDCVVVSTERFKNELLAYADCASAEERQRTPRIEVVLNGIDFPHASSSGFRLRDHYGVAADTPVFLYVGQLVFEKEIPFLLDALARLKARGQPFKMLLVGDGPYRSVFEARAAELGIADHCVFIGQIHDKRLLAQHYAQSDLFLFPSLYETQGLVVMEAASCGLATVGQRDAPGLSDVLRHDDTGFFAPRDPAAYAELVLALCADPMRVKRVAARAKACVVRFDETVANLGAIYRSLSERQVPPLESDDAIAA